MNFVALMFFSEKTTGDGINAGKQASKEDLYELYLKNALLLHKTVKKIFNKPLVLYTNKKEYVEKFFSNQDGPLVEELIFDLNIPFGVKFYSAHYKIELMRHLSFFPNNYYIMIDLDVFFVRKPSDFVFDMIKAGMPMLYDITNMIYQTYDEKVIRKDFIGLNNYVYQGRWFGGEFVGGTGVFFKDIVARIDGFWETYVEKINDFHHQGDEMLLNAAVDGYMRSGGLIADVGEFGVIVRYWSGHTICVQKSAEYATEHCSAIHAPQDKKWIAKYVDKIKILNLNDLVVSYKIYTKQRVLRNLLAKSLKKWSKVNE